LIEYLVAGGPVMIPIGLCSVVALATFLERLWALRMGRIIPPAFAAEFVELGRQERWGDAMALCSKWNVASARVLEVALEVRDQSRSVIKERIEEVGRREAAEMERNVPILGTIASISPLLGLLGTVGGMILTFQVISEEGAANVGSLAAGISQALITTFAGLSVGIPAVVANRFVLSRVDSLLLELEELSLSVLEILVTAHDSGEVE
jgi:biopolymer transport protein ExbB